MKTTKKLLTLVILSVIGTSSMAFCPSGPNYWACYEQEMQTIRQQQQLNQIIEMQQQQMQQRQNNQINGNVPCYAFNDPFQRSSCMMYQGGNALGNAFK